MSCWFVEVPQIAEVCVEHHIWYLDTVGWSALWRSAGVARTVRD
jgi:hypothetical protein